MNEKLTEKPDLAPLSRHELIEEVRASWDACDTIGQLADDLQEQLKHARMNAESWKRSDAEYRDLAYELLGELREIHTKFSQHNMILACRVVKSVEDEYRQRYNSIGIPF